MRHSNRPASTIPLLFLLLLLYGLVGHWDYQDQRRDECSRQQGSYIAAEDRCDIPLALQPLPKPANLRGQRKPASHPRPSSSTPSK